MSKSYSEYLAQRCWVFSSMIADAQCREARDDLTPYDSGVKQEWVCQYILARNNFIALTGRAPTGSDM